MPKNISNLPVCTGGDKAASARPAPAVVFRALIRHFGPQGWWPTTKPGCIKPIYQPGRWCREAEREKFEICVGAILTQNTAWRNVERAFENLHAARMCTPRGLARARRTTIAALIRPSGYYNQKAERLQLFARHVLKKCGGKTSRLFIGPAGSARTALLELNGIGPETADSMLLYAGGLPSFVVDAYTLRLAWRLGWFTGSSYDAARQFFERRLARSVRVYNEFHALVVALGKDFCRKKPVCGPCPLKKLCSAGKAAAGRKYG